MLISEIFYSIQGEGQWTGLPNIFIRTAGCNLRCTYCDTTYAYDSGEEIKMSQILKKIAHYPCSYITITGGEPLLQLHLNELLKKLLQKNYIICVETNGSISIKNYLNKKVMFSLDIKCPSSKMHRKMCFENLSYVTLKDQVKFIIKNREDYKYAKNILYKYQPKASIFFQQIWGTSSQPLAKWILSDGLSVKLGVQIHKVIWGDIKGK